MRALGIDLGSKRSGIAVSDRSGTIASPLTVMQRSGSQRRDHEAIHALVVEHEAELLVVGLPLNMNGSSGPQAAAAITEAEALATVVGVPVITF
ncbi:MAG: Holliday junction resolvase RuvX, partial [Actinomycetota bacterium]